MVLVKLQLLLCCYLNPKLFAVIVCNESHRRTDNLSAITSRCGGQLMKSAQHSGFNLFGGFMTRNLCIEQVD